MSLTIDFNYIFTEVYPSQTLEQLQDFQKELQGDIEYIKERAKTASCTCGNEHHSVSTYVGKKGIFKVSFDIPSEDLCVYCQNTLKDFPSHLKAAGFSSMDHWHPRLLLITGKHQEDLLAKALFCKKKNYASLTFKEIKELVKDTLEYSGYLSRTETSFQCEGRQVPLGLIKAILENDLEVEALEFEVKSRALQGLMELDVNEDDESVIQSEPE